MADDLAQAIISSAQRLQVNPADLATVISYETAGTFDPWKAGPRTQWGQHRGLIQWGEPQRQKYGVFQGMTNTDQLKAVERYMTDAGVKPNMGLLDLYSAVNAGRVKRYNASDANNGGAWGTVADKVNYQMDGHRKKAEQLLSGKYTPMQQTPATQQAPQAVTQQPPQAAPTQPGVAFNPFEAAGASPAGLANMFLQNQAARQKRRKDEQEAEQIRRAALFSQSPYG